MLLGLFGLELVVDMSTCRQSPRTHTWTDGGSREGENCYQTLPS